MHLLGIMVLLLSAHLKQTQKLLQNVSEAKEIVINANVIFGWLKFRREKRVSKSYLEFLKSKQNVATDAGFDASDLNEHLFQYEADIVRWALKKGKAALFEDCGLGKSIQQLSWAEKVSEHTGKSVLIVAPLSVAHQTVREGEKFGIKATYAPDGSAVTDTGLYTTNYERLSGFDASKFSGVVLDESSILKDYTSSTKQTLIDMFKDTPYKLCCTATPSPNDYVELGNHAEFLGIMSRTEMLATYFVHDGGETQKWRLKGHAQQAFFAWVASWACCMTHPSDLGYEMIGFNLPELRLHEIEVKTGTIEAEDGQFGLFPQVSMSLMERRKARRDSLTSRAQKAVEIALSEDTPCLLWCDLNSEQDDLERLLGDRAFSVRGATPSDLKVEYERRWREGERKILISKPSVFGYGMNWQHCSREIFVGLSDSFEAYYQAVRRCWRFGQTMPVDVYIVISEAEGAVKANIERKQADAIRMTQELVKYTKDILKSDVRHTTRITETYFTNERMDIPKWMQPA